MFTRLSSLSVFCSLLWLVAGAPNTDVVRSLDRRTCPEQPILYASFVAGCNDCKCPIDLNGDSGVLINVYPGYQCAYPAGPCMWSDTVRKPQFLSSQITDAFYPRLVRFRGLDSQIVL